MIQNISNRPLVFAILMALLIGFLVSGCKDKDTPEPVQETGTLTDADGNVYKTVKIGDQWWMAENLKVKTYANGIAIQQLQSGFDWQSSAEGYCVYDNNASAPGVLYNFAAVISANKLAPNGWHIPTDDEWKKLEEYLGMSNDQANRSAWRGTGEGDKLKIEGPQGWSESEDAWGNNQSGFTALAGSCRLHDGTFGNPGLFATAFWWSSTPHNNDEAYYRHLDYKKSSVFRSHARTQYGMSIRCVKD